MGELRRRHKLVLTLETDTEEEMFARLGDIPRRIRAGEFTTGVSGGYSSNAIYRYTVDEDVTHDSYFEALEAHLTEEAADAAPSERKDG